MKTTTEKVTPAIARKWLEVNVDNRPVRPAHVEELRMMFARGEYMHIPASVSFDVEGHLCDGQHRLLAIEQLAEDWQGEMQVTRGVPVEAFKVIDTKQAARSIADVLKIERALSEASSLVARLYLANGAGVSSQYVAPFAAWLSADCTDLMDYCAATTRCWSSAPVRAAALLALKMGHDRDYVKLVYKAMVQADFDTMPPVAKVMYRAHDMGRVASVKKWDMLCRCLRMFDPRNAKHKKIVIPDQAEMLQQLRELIDQQMHGGKKARRGTLRLAKGNGAQPAART